MKDQSALDVVALALDVPWIPGEPIAEMYARMAQAAIAAYRTTDEYKAEIEAAVLKEREACAANKRVAELERALDEALCVLDADADPTTFSRLQGILGKRPAPRSRTLAHDGEKG